MQDAINITRREVHLFAMMRCLPKSLGEANIISEATSFAVRQTSLKKALANASAFLQKNDKTEQIEAKVKMYTFSYVLISIAFVQMVVYEYAILYNIRSICDKYTNPIIT